MKNLRKKMNNMPNGWMQLTRKDYPDNLEFAIAQLEKSGKKYRIQNHSTDGRISVWVKKP
jgi:hypothetical protein|tara:strand:- start:11797 stop:11976 length:180 start_codon:yes stop_codon:yes gene_type:complete